MEDPRAELTRRRWEDLTDVDRARILAQLAHMLAREAGQVRLPLPHAMQALRLLANLQAIREGLAPGRVDDGTPRDALIGNGLKDGIGRLREVGRWAAAEADCPWWDDLQHRRLWHVGRYAGLVADRLEQSRGR